MNALYKIHNNPSAKYSAEEELEDRALKKLVRNNEIPYYQRNKEVYFFEDELVKWVEDARVAPYYEQIRKMKGRYR